MPTTKLELLHAMSCSAHALQASLEAHDYRAVKSDALALFNLIQQLEELIAKEALPHL